LITVSPHSAGRRPGSPGSPRYIHQQGLAGVCSDHHGSGQVIPLLIAQDFFETLQNNKTPAIAGVTGESYSHSV